MAESGEEPVKPQKQPAAFTRRTFLKGLGALGAGSLLNWRLGENHIVRAAPAPQASGDTWPTESHKLKELKAFTSNVTIIDASPEYSNNEMVEKMLEGKNISGAQRLLLYKCVDGYFTHGAQVKEAMNMTWEQMGLKSSGVAIKPLQEIFGPDSVQFVTDAQGNPGVSLNFNPQKIITLLEGDQNQVINMSFQVGDVAMHSVTKTAKEYVSGTNTSEVAIGMIDENDNFYEGAVAIVAKDGKIIYLDTQGKEVIGVSEKEYEKKKEEEGIRKEEIIVKQSTTESIVGAYTKEKAEQNLPKLFEVCRAYPNKLFVVAAGNEGEDFREALQRLEDRPQNLLIVAQCTSGEYEGQSGTLATQNVYGADVYVDNSKLGLSDGSSFSTSVVAAYAEQLLRENDVNIDDVREKFIARFCRLDTLASPENPPIMANIFTSPPQW